MKYTEIAKYAPQCFGCGKANEGDCVLAHRNRNGWGLLSGGCLKGLSLSGAILCTNKCHVYADGEGRRDYEFWELAAMRTQAWAWDAGYVRFVPKGGDPDMALR